MRLNASRVHRADELACAFRRALGRSILLIMRFTALPSPWRGAPASRAIERWLRSHYLLVTAISVILLILNEIHIFGTYLPAWDWLFVSGWITFLLTFRVTFWLPDRVDEVLDRLAASRVLVDCNNKLGDSVDSDNKLGRFKQELHESA
jgi:hypothetical protein